MTTQIHSAMLQDSGNGAEPVPELREADAAPLPDIEALHECFLAELRPWHASSDGGHVYLLLDPAHPVSPHEQLDVDALAKRPSRRVVEVVVRPDLAHEPSLLPRLVQLHAAGESGLVDKELLESSFLCAVRRCRSIHGAYVAGWLLTHEAPAAVAAHLASAGVLFDMKRGGERYVSLFEPYRLALWHDGLEDRTAALRRWFGPIERWLFIDSGCNLRRLDRPATSLDSERGSKNLTVAESDAQDRVGIGRVVLTALTHAGLVLPDRPEHRIDVAVRRAQRHGLRDTEDIVFHALNDFSLGTGWSAHPRAAELIASCSADPDLGLVAQFNALGDDAIDAIAAYDPRG